MKVAKLQDNSLHGLYIPNHYTYTNVVKDCNDNFIVSMTMMNWILEYQTENELPLTEYEEIDYCEIPEELEGE